MNTMTRCLSGAAAVAIHPHRCEVRREPPTLSPVRDTQCVGRRELGRQGRWRGYTGTLNRGWDLSGHVNSALGILSQIIQTKLSVFNGTVGYIVHMWWRGSGAGDW